MSDQAFNVSLPELVAEGYSSYYYSLLADGYTDDEALLQTQFYRALKEVQSLQATIAAANAAGGAALAAVPGLQSQLTFWIGQMQAANGAVSASEHPGAFVSTLSDFSDQALTIAKQAGAGVAALPGAAATLVKDLPTVLIFLVLGFGLWLLWKYVLSGSAAGA